MASDAGGGGGGFPTPLFTIEDDPGAVRESTDGYRSMSRQARHTHDTLTGLTVASWRGAEGDLFRQRRATYEPMMSIATRVFGAFVTQVITFATTLQGLKTRMDELRAEAEKVWAELQAAEAAQVTAATDLAAAAVVTMRAAPMGPTTAATTLAAAQTAYGDATAAVASARSRWDDCVRRANALHADLKEAADTAAAAIGRLEGPPTVPSAAGDPGDAPTIDINGTLLPGQRLPVPPKPVETMTSDEVKRWWASLTAAQRGALARTDPEKWGSLPGVPAADRDQINRFTLDREKRDGQALFTRAGLPVPTSAKDIAELTEADLVALGVRRVLHRDKGGKPIVTAPVPDQVAALERYKGALVLDDDLRKHPLDSRSPSYLYAYEPGLYEGRGRSLVSIGNPETATNVAVFVPGLTSRTATMGGPLEDARQLRTSAQRVDPKATTAILVWQGYDAPQLDGNVRERTIGRDFAVIGEEKADAGAQLLARDVAALRATRSGTGTIGVLAHSYGSTTAGLAAQHYGLSNSVDHLTLLGSPGPGQGGRTVQDLHLRPDQVYVASASRDPVTGVGGVTGGLAHGSDPASADFGATRIKAESVDRGRFLNIDDHSRYVFDGGESESRTALANIVTGHGDRLASQGLLAPGRYVEFYPDGTVAFIDPETGREPQRVAPVEGRP